MAFRNDPACAADVREFVREACSGALSQGELDVAVLLANELVANAMLHTDSERFEVHVQVRRGGLRIGVRDDGRTSPAPSTPGKEDTAGRGLQIVDRLSKTWGVKYGEGGGKCVWFSLPRSRFGRGV